MSELSEKDWELINAYHDGELSDAGRQELESRFLSEPALKEALRDVASVSASLGALRPEVQPTNSQQIVLAANENRRLIRWLAGGAVAAAFALAIALGPQFNAEPSVFDIHAEFAAQSFSVEDDEIQTVMVGKNVNAPDLLSANLKPVAARQMNNGSVTHYAGRNGCRLSYFRGTPVLGNQAPAAERNQVATWSTADDMRHMIIATGMDQGKFDAIAEYLKLATRQQASEQMMASLADTTASAERCLV